MTWYDFACAYTDMKWKAAAAGYRKNIARALTAATPDMLTADRGKPEGALLRKRPAPPTSSGRRAAASTARRHRVILANALDYAHELGAIDAGKKTRPRSEVECTDQAHDGGPAQRRQLPPGTPSPRRGARPGAERPRLAAFFATIYYAGLRPEEVITLRKSNLTLPPLRWNTETCQWEGVPGSGSDGWGEPEFGDASPAVGRDWTDDGGLRDRRQLKHRAIGDTRTVPVTPGLAKLLREYVQKFGASPDGKLFTGVRTRIRGLPAGVDRRTGSGAPEEQQASPLARRIYDLRHACLSGWLNVGVPPIQVAKWQATVTNDVPANIISRHA